MNQIQNFNSLQEQYDQQKSAAVNYATQQYDAAKSLINEKTSEYFEIAGVSEFLPQLIESSESLITKALKFGNSYFPQQTAQVQDAITTLKQTAIDGATQIKAQAKQAIDGATSQLKEQVNNASEQIESGINQSVSNATDAIKTSTGIDNDLLFSASNTAKDIGLFDDLNPLKNATAQDIFSPSGELYINNIQRLNPVSELPTMKAATNDEFSFLSERPSFASYNPSEISSTVENVAQSATKDIVPSAIENVAATTATKNIIPSAIENIAATTAETAGKDTIASTLETVGSTLDATGEGSIIGVPLQLIGIGLGGWSLAKGFLNLFDSKSVAPVIPEQMAMPTFQAQ